MASKGVSQQDHRRILELNGWTQQEWDTGRKSDWDEKSEHEIQERIKEIPVRSLRQFANSLLLKLTIFSLIFISSPGNDEKSRYQESRGG